MKTTDNGYTITGVAGLDSIEIVPGGEGEEPHIVLVPDDAGRTGEPRAYDIKTLGALHDALRLAINLASVMDSGVSR